MIHAALMVVSLLASRQERGDTAGGAYSWREVIPTGTTLEIRGVIGSISARAASGKEAQVFATRTRGHRGDPAQVEIRIIRQPNRIIVCTIYPRDDRWNRNNDHVEFKDPCEAAQWEKVGRGDNDTRVDYEIQVPAGVHFIGQTVTANVLLAGLRGDAEGYSIAGDVRVSDVRGGVIDAASISGNITFDRVDAADVYAGTLSGDVHFTGALRAAGEYSFLSHTGEITVNIPPAAGVTFNVSAPKGQVTSSVPLTPSSHSWRRSSGRQGSGSAGMTLNSLNGEIHIQSLR
ncbi:MAG: DUF4097 family beta strand repeat-containing protein [Gemmatimonadota bacterium]